MKFMKTNGTRFVLIAVLVQLLFLLVSFTAAAQPDYAFKNGVLVSGTDKKEGAKYRFNNVRSGTDAFVTITKIDKVTLSQLDGPSGFDDAFQPYIKCPAKTKGYVEFRFDFLIGGTNLPKLMLEVPVTAIDVDGYVYPDEKVYEFDEFNFSLGYLINWDLLGTALNVNFKGGEVQALNKTAKDYPGIDTLQKDVMFTMIYAAVTSITIRTGVDNRSKTDVERLRSDYFKRFNYANSFLAAPALTTFTGLEKNNKVDLNWTVSSDNSLSKVILEKGSSPSDFKPISEVWMNDGSTTKTRFAYSDNSGINTVAYYRLKMQNVTGEFHYSNVLAFRSTNNTQQFKVYPSAVDNTVSVNLKSASSGSALFQVVDYSGRVVKQQNMTVRDGNNNLMVGGLDKIIAGNYIVVVKTDDNQIYTQKIVKN
jgi:hypothetical protein